VRNDNATDWAILDIGEENFSPYFTLKSSLARGEGLRIYPRQWV